MNRLSMLGLAAVCSVAAISVASAQGGPMSPQQRAEAAVKLRQGLFQVQAFAFGPVGAMLKNQMPFNAQAAELAAKRVEVTSSMIPDVFRVNTSKDTGLKTRALDGIWTNKADFDQKAHDLNQAAMNLEMAAMGGDKAQTMQAAIAVGKACGACHDQFRAK
ncbi:MAG TPA: cytochrome c [Steroidobacteraceae bacterium]|nr:cytochrome c [Steroidobacteraceae bacterium]